MKYRHTRSGAEFKVTAIHKHCHDTIVTKEPRKSSHSFYKLIFQKGDAVLFSNDSIESEFTVIKTRAGRTPANLNHQYNDKQKSSAKQQNKNSIKAGPGTKARTRSR